MHSLWPWGWTSSLLVRATVAAPFLTDYRGTWLELHLMRRIQQALDPLVLINPGKLLKFE